MANPLLEQIKKMSDEEKAELAKILAGTGVLPSAPAGPTKKYVQGGRFWTTISRYVHDKYITATPDIPALVTFDKKIRIEVDDEGMPLDKSLIPAKEAKPEPPKAEPRIDPFHKKRTGPPGKAEEGGKRPSDEDPGQ